MESWGTVMRLYYNKDTSYTMSDWTNNYLGYWTDHGTLRVDPEDLLSWGIGERT